MKYLIKKARVVYPDRTSQKTDILVQDGIFKLIAKDIEDAEATIIESPNLHVSIGWLDIGTQIGEPGYEERETIETVVRAAAHGGYTALANFPNTNPCIDNKSTLSYITNAFKLKPIDIFPIAAISKGTAGQDISEMVDLAASGAAAFSDGKKTILNTGLLLRALLYAKRTGKILINFPNDSTLTDGATMHEGEVSTSLGLEGMADVAEHIMVKRDMDISEYAETNIILHNISSAQSIKLIKQARRDDIYCSVAAMNLIHTDEALETFNPVFKVSPPLRLEKDRRALVKALNKNRIQYISSNHTPIELENKDLEFTRSALGASTLDTVFASLNTYNKNELSLNTLIQKLAYGPRQVLKLAIPELKEGESANITLFDPNKEWTVSNSNLASKSKNNPYIGQKLTGKVLGIINKNQAIIHP